MALDRSAITPRCIYCGEIIAKEKHRDQSHIPINQRVIGDTFEGWDYIDHDCKPTKQAAQKLWDKLGDIPIDEDECIEEPYHTFPKGTHREDIWHWFEETFNLSVTELMFKEDGRESKK